MKELINLWDLSILGTEIGTKQNFDDRKWRNLDWCLAYGRDRGESDIHAISHANLKELRKYFNQSWCEYVYIFDIKKMKWFYFTCGNSKLKELTISEIEKNASS